MSFAVGVVEPLIFPKHDPTTLDSVLLALRATTKGCLPYPEPLDDDLTTDICDVKYIGDLSHITSSKNFINEVSFSDAYNTSAISIFANDDDDDDDDEENEEDFKDFSDFKDIRDFNKDFEEFRVDHSADKVDGVNTGLGRREPDWTAYRGSSTKSPLKSPTYSPLREQYRRENDDVTGDLTLEDESGKQEGQEFQHNIETLLARLSAGLVEDVSSNVRQFREDYVARIKSIHKQVRAAQAACVDSDGGEQSVREERDHQQQQQMLRDFEEQNNIAMANKAQEAEQRRAQLLATLALASALEAEETERLEQEERREAEADREKRQAVRAALVAQLRASYEQFSATLVHVLKEMQKVSGAVQLSPETDEDLNVTLKIGGEVVAAEADAEGSGAEAEVLHSTTERLTRGITVLHQIQGVIDTKKSENLSVSSSQPSTALCLASDNPTTAKILSSAREAFNSLCQVHQTVAEAANQLTTQNSELRSQLSRALTIVNQFNNDNPASNRQKLHQLCNLVTGGVCETGSAKVSCGPSDGPAAMFVKEQVASRLISLAHDKQVSSQAVYASLMLRLWQVDPMLQQLCLYHLYKSCPYLVPYVPLREDYQSDEEYHRALGYRHKDGCEREALDIYVKRMCAAGQLYGRLVSIQMDNSPQSLDGGWQWLSRLMVTPAQSAVTCTVLHGFLSIAGAQLCRVYGQQFNKLITLLVNKYLPMLEQATMEGGEADLETLKALLSNYCTKRAFDPPSEGYRSLL